MTQPTTITSISGGRTSAYIAANYPADYIVFALVCIDCHNAGAHIDKAIKRMVNDRLQKFCSHWPEFVATSEDPQVLRTIFDLEQKIGQEIVWLRGIGWEQAIRWRQCIPNKIKRWCTTWFKIVPIFEWCLKYTGLPVRTNIGYRYDEMERADAFFGGSLKYPVRCERYKSGDWKHRWEVFENWQTPVFPLIRDKVMRPQIMKFWEGSEIKFAADSNCQNCFWKPEQQLRENFKTNASIMRWAQIQEDLAERTFKESMNMEQISRLGMQLDFLTGTGAGCNAGFCHD